MAETTFTPADMAKEARREVGQRRRVYPRLIESGRLTQAAADRQTAVMEAIAAHFDRLAAAESARGDLFGAAPDARPLTRAPTAQGSSNPTANRGEADHV